jgi:hypothetical protein
MLYWIVSSAAGFMLACLICGLSAAITIATYFVVFLLGFCFGRTSYMLSLVKFEEQDERQPDSNPWWLIDLREP